jgi:hypothetical protein
MAACCASLIAAGEGDIETALACLEQGVAEA